MPGRFPLGRREAKFKLFGRLIVTGLVPIVSLIIFAIDTVEDGVITGAN